MPRRWLDARRGDGDVGAGLRRATSKAMAGIAIAIAIVAQGLMFLAETLGDMSDEWNSDG